MQTTRMEFESDGATLVGNLYRPDTEARGAVITTGPLTSVKEQAAGAYAAAMASRGFAALAFDHRHFGESGGQPRQLESPLQKAADIRAAALALETSGVARDLPIFGLGVCAGAGYMVEAVAGDRRFTAFAGVAGVYSSAEATHRWMGAGYDAAIARARAAESLWRSTGEVETIPAVAPDNGDVAMPLDEAFAYYGTPRGAVANYVNGFAVQSRAHTLPFDVQHLAREMSLPSLIVHSENALMPGLAREFYLNLAAPKDDLWLRSVGQIDFYDDPALIGQAADAIAEHFARSAGRTVSAN